MEDSYKQIYYDDIKPNTHDIKMKDFDVNDVSLKVIEVEQNAKRSTTTDNS